MPRSAQLWLVFVGVLSALAGVFGLYLAERIFIERCPDDARGAVLREWAESDLVGLLMDRAVDASVEYNAPQGRDHFPRTNAFPTATCEAVWTGTRFAPESGVAYVGIGRFADSAVAASNLDDMFVPTDRYPEERIERSDTTVVVDAGEVVGLRRVEVDHVVGCVIVSTVVNGSSPSEAVEIADAIATAAADAVCGSEVER